MVNRWTAEQSPTKRPALHIGSRVNPADSRVIGFSTQAVRNAWHDALVAAGAAGQPDSPLPTPVKASATIKIASHESSQADLESNAACTVCEVVFSASKPGVQCRACGRYACLSCTVRARGATDSSQRVCGMCVAKTGGRVDGSGGSEDGSKTFMQWSSGSLTNMVRGVLLVNVSLTQGAVLFSFPRLSRLERSARTTGR